MKKVTSAPTLVTVAHYKNLLESEGIEAFVRNEHLGGVMGELPFQEVWPELWIKNDLDLIRAKQLIDDSIVDESPTEPWVCKSCGSENEGQFAVCWNCEKPGSE